MKELVCAAMLLLGIVPVKGQNRGESSDFGQICFEPHVIINGLDEGPDVSFLKSEMVKSILDANQCASQNSSSIVALDVTITTESMGGTPTIYSSVAEYSLMVFDKFSKEIYAQSYGESSSEGGTMKSNRKKTLKGLSSSALSGSGFWGKCTEKIISLYGDRCDEIITRSKGLLTQECYDEAIFNLLVVPQVDANCYAQCQDQARVIYVAKINHESEINLNKARAIWSGNRNENGAKRAMTFLMDIDPDASNYQEVEQLMDEVKMYLQEKEKEEFELKCTELIELKKEEIEAIKEIGVAFGRHQPSHIYQTPQQVQKN